MKKYFAKYLPVEGEIKEGDRWWVKTLPQVYPLPADKSTLDYWNTQFGNQKDFSKVNLFLCSRDIRVGDKVIYKSHIESHWFKGTVAVYTNSYTAFEEDRDNDGDKESFYINYDSKDVYKIVGEISPEASWVKEGDEFDEGEVKIYERKDFSHWDSEDELERNPIWRTYNNIEILGPCGHFH